MADKQIHELTAATQVNDNDLLVLQQDGAAKKLPGSVLVNYVSAGAQAKVTELSNAIDAKIEEVQEAIDTAEGDINTIVQVVESMTELGTDTTLTVEGMAADAKAAGDRIKDAETAGLAGLDQGQFSGVPIATFDDGAENVPVKALSIAIEPVQDLHGYDNPWPAGGGKNLLIFPYLATGTITDAGVTYTIQNDGTVIANNTATTTSQVNLYGTSWENYISVESGETYTLTGTTVDDTVVIAYLYKDGVAYGEQIARKNQSVTFTVPSDGEYRARMIVRVNNGASVSNAVIKPMLAKGSTALPFEPYSNICPITGWTEANVTRTGKNMFDSSKLLTASNWTVSDGVYTGMSAMIRYQDFGNIFDVNGYEGRVSFSFDGYVDYSNSRAGYFKFNYTDGTYTSSIEFLGQEWKHYQATSTAGKVVKSIDFTMSNNRSVMLKNLQIEYNDAPTAFEPFGTVYNINFPSEAGTVYGGTLDVTKGKLTVEDVLETFDSSTGFTKVTSYTASNRYTKTLSQTAKFSGTSFSFVAANIFNVNSRSSAELNCQIISNNRIDLYFPLSTGIDDVTKLGTFFTSTPLQVVYGLATPIEYTLTPTEVKTLLGLNNIWADTGNILDLIYRKQPISIADVQEQIDAIKEIIADREDDGIASKNYSAGSLILIGDDLCETIGPITTGESIVLGSNCVVTTVAAQIEYLKNIVDGINNAAYLSYEVVS